MHRSLTSLSTLAGVAAPGQGTVDNGGFGHRVRADGTAAVRHPERLLSSRPVPSAPHYRGWARGATFAAAALIAGGGYVHFCLYRHGYRSIPTIGRGFLLQFTSSAVIAAALVVVRGAWYLGRHRVPLAQVARLSGFALAVGTLVALAIAHTSGGLFGFRETGLQPSPQTVITVIVEFDAAVLLLMAMACSWLSEHHATRGEGPRSTGARDPDAA
jgi:hypothetical protein